MPQSNLGKFISFEGCDGCGKSTQLAKVKTYLEKKGYSVVAVREPGSTEISEKIRAILLDIENKAMVARSELLLYEAARSQLVEEIIRPSLLEGKWVVSDRYADSTYAYQKGGRDLDKDMIQKANELGTGGVWPDLTLVLELPADKSLDRADSDHEPDRLELEGITFQERVLAGFKELSMAEPERIKMVDAQGSPDEVFSHVKHFLEAEFPELI